jgi:hypothetical protein
MLEEYKLTKSRNDRLEVLEERAQILEIASRKAQERTLTLKETTDLYAKFNSTYESTYKRSNSKDDESWALKLIQECVDETLQPPSLESKVNGITVVNGETHSISKKPSLTEIKSLKIHTSLDDAIFVETKPKLRDSFVYEQLYLNSLSESPRYRTNSHQSFVTILAISIAISLSALIGISIFL